MAQWLMTVSHHRLKMAQLYCAQKCRKKRAKKPLLFWSELLSMCTTTAAPRLVTRKAVIVDAAFWCSGMKVAEQCVHSCTWNDSKGIQLLLLNIIIFVQYGLKPPLLGTLRHITHTQCVHDVQVGYLWVWVCVCVCVWVKGNWGRLPFPSFK